MARILVVEDDEQVARLACRFLESGGHEVASAAEGAEGMRQFRRLAPDLVVCDIFMPNREGLETIREMRRLSAFTPILAMTGGGSAGDVSVLEMAARLGADRVITKPFSREGLVGLVNDLLGSAASRGSSAARGLPP